MRVCYQGCRPGTNTKSSCPHFRDEKTEAPTFQKLAQGPEARKWGSWGLKQGWLASREMSSQLALSKCPLCTAFPQLPRHLGLPGPGQHGMWTRQHGFQHLPLDPPGLPQPFLPCSGVTGLLPPPVPHALGILFARGGGWDPPCWPTCITQVRSLHTHSSPSGWKYPCVHGSVPQTWYTRHSASHWDTKDTVSALCPCPDSP